MTRIHSRWHGCGRCSGRLARVRLGEYAAGLRVSGLGLVSCCIDLIRNVGGLWLVSHYTELTKPADGLRLASCYARLIRCVNELGEHGIQLSMCEIRVIRYGN